MSGSQLGVALSLAAHALAGVLAAGWRIASPPRATIMEPEAPEAEPIEIEMYVEPAPSPVQRRDLPPAPRAPERDRPARPPAIEHVRTQAPETPTVPAPDGGPAVELSNRLPAPARTLAVRGLPALPSTPAIERIAAQVPASVASPPSALPAPSTFTMRVDPDGSAHLTDRRNVHLALGTNAAEVAEGRAEQWLDGHHERSNAIETKLPPAGAVVARFDVTDWAIRAGGKDPYAYEKLKVLDATRDARAQIRARHDDRQALETPALVRATLDHIAALVPPRRHAALLELWHDCADSTAGEIARSTILDYVRTHAAFSDDDRAALDDR